MTYDLADWMSVRARPPASSATMRYSSVKVPPATRGRSATQGGDECAGVKRTLPVRDPTLWQAATTHSPLGPDERFVSARARSRQRWAAHQRPRRNARAPCNGGGDECGGMKSVLSFELYLADRIDRWEARRRLATTRPSEAHTPKSITPEPDQRGRRLPADPAGELQGVRAASIHSPTPGELQGGFNRKNTIERTRAICSPRSLISSCMSHDVLTFGLQSQVVTHVRRQRDDEDAWCSVIGVSPDGELCPAMACMVEDSGDDACHLVVGGAWGLRFKDSSLPWELENREQWGAFLLRGRRTRSAVSRIGRACASLVASFARRSVVERWRVSPVREAGARTDITCTLPAPIATFRCDAPARTDKQARLAFPCGSRPRVLLP